jgi:hypothetical protein
MVRIASDANVRRRDERAEPGEEVERVEQDGVGAVLPRGLEREAHAAVGLEREALLGQRRAQQVAARALASRMVARVDGDLRMDVDSAHLGERLVGRGHDTDGTHENLSVLRPGAAPRSCTSLAEAA